MSSKIKFFIPAVVLLAPHLTSSTTTPPIPKPEHIEFVGIQKSLTANVGRDLGFSGKVGNTILNTFGDTTKCGLGPDWENGCGYPGASNSVAKNSPNDPLAVLDFQHYLQEGWVQQFCDTYSDEPRKNGEFAVGITNIIPVTPTEGMLFFLLNNRTTPSLSNFPGSGVARINLTEAYPTCTRLKNNKASGRAKQYWFGYDEPAYGDHAAVLGKDGYIYAMGGMSNAATGADKNLSNHGLYMTRVKQAEYADWSAYEYWHGKEHGWTGQRLHNPGPEACVLPGIGQGSMIYSPHFDGYLFMYSFDGGLVARLAYRPEGPWSSEFNTIYDMGCVSFGCSYSPSVMPWWDHSGKTLYVQYSHAGDYHSHVLKITWPGNGLQPASAFPYDANFGVNSSSEKKNSCHVIEHDTPKAVDQMEPNSESPMHPSHHNHGKAMHKTNKSH